MPTYLNGERVPKTPEAHPYDPRLYRGAHTRAFLRAIDGNLDGYTIETLIADVPDFLQRLADDIRREAMERVQISGLCKRRGEALEAAGLPNVYLHGCCS